MSYDPYAAQGQQGAYSGANSSGQGDTTVVPTELQGLNWGAFFLGWIWSAFNGGGALWIIIGLLFSPIDRIFLLFKGNDVSWKGKRWDSVEGFKDTQRKWAIAGLIILVISLVFACIAIVAGGILGAASGSN